EFLHHNSMHHLMRSICASKISNNALAGIPRFKLLARLLSQ
ncbi:MAG: hypothetical protein ACI8XX_001764, partial [Polaribacter sp.]